MRGSSEEVKEVKEEKKLGLRSPTDPEVRKGRFYPPTRQCGRTPKTPDEIGRRWSGEDDVFVQEDERREKKKRKEGKRQ